MEHAIGIVERKYAWYRTISIPIAYWSNYVFIFVVLIRLWKVQLKSWNQSTSLQDD